MLLSEINKKWNTYKEQYGLDSGVQIEEIRLDAAKGVDASFDFTELFSDQYILHLNPEIHLYRSEYIDYILWHEFTHLYDFLTQPFAYNVMRKIYLYLNTYSEYHASRRALGRILQDIDLERFDPEKQIIPAAFKDISLRDLISDTLYKAELSRYYYRVHKTQQAFHIYLRYVMYLMGYASHFKNAENIIRFCLEDLEEDLDVYLTLYQLMREKDFFKILPHMDDIYKKAGLTFESSAD